MRMSACQTRFSNAAPRISRITPGPALSPAKYAASHRRAPAMIGDSRSTISCGGKWRLSRASRRVIGLSGPMNSSAHSPSSDASASISPTGVEMVDRLSCMMARLSKRLTPIATLRWLRELDEMPDDATLFLDELADAQVREIEQRVQRVAAERDRLGGPLHFDEAPVSRLDDVHVHVGAAVVVVGQIKERLAVDDADAGRRHVVGERNRA